MLICYMNYMYTRITHIAVYTHMHTCYIYIYTHICIHICIHCVFVQRWFIRPPARARAPSDEGYAAQGEAVGFEVRRTESGDH